jgi:tRNA dimethylallyltransferase
VYQQQARALINAINNRQRLPILVGGTGQYVRQSTKIGKFRHKFPLEDMRAAIEAWANALALMRFTVALSALTRKQHQY